jgi:RHS repeat-associated protein
MAQCCNKTGRTILKLKTDMKNMIRLWVMSFLAAAVVTRAETVFWSDGFETNGPSRWTTNSTWRVGSPTSGPVTNSLGYRSHSGTNCAITFDPSNADIRMICTNYNGATTLTVPAANQFPRLRFWQWFSFVNAGGYVEINNGSGWQTISQTNKSFAGTANTSSGVWSRPSIDLSAFAGQNVQIAFHFSSGASGYGTDLGWYVDDVAVVTGTPVLNSPESFELGMGDWSVNAGTWEAGKPTSGPPTNSAGLRAHSGTNCMATALSGTYGYNVDTRLISPAITIPSSGPASFRFWQWYDFINAQGFVEIKTNNGPWQSISRTNLSFATAAVMSGGWINTAIDVSAYAGQTVQMAFHFISGASGYGSAPGWYIDDVSLDIAAPILNDPEGFEYGEGDWSTDSGDWQIGKPTSGPGSGHSGTNCAATVLAGNYDYNMDTRLISPSFTVPFINSPTFRYWQWYSFVNANGVVEIKTFGGSWQAITPVIQSFGNNGVASGGWTNSAIDLSAYVGQTVQIAFHFTSGPSGYYGTAPGWYIDDITFPHNLPNINITALSSYVYSGGPVGQFNISRSGGLTGALNVNLASTGTAVAGTDYVALPTNFTFGAGITSTNITVTIQSNAVINTAKTVVLGLLTNAYYVPGLYTNAVLTLIPLSSTTNSVPSPVGRYWRGSGSNPTYLSQVIPLDYETGTIYSNLNGNCLTLYPGLSAWNSQTLYHYDATNSLSQTNPAGRIAFNNPIVAFGERTGGTPLYISQPYNFGIYAGDPLLTTTQIVIQAYYRTNLQLAGSISVNPPNPANNAAMDSFATNGFQVTSNAFGLTTTLSGSPYLNWGNASAGAYVLTHTATGRATNYYYVVEVSGYPHDGSNAMAINSSGTIAPSLLYTLEFESRPPWRSVFLDQPHFDGSPLPPFYTGKTVAEMLTNTPPVTNVVSFTPSAATNLDDSPELRRHPTLDNFVASMGNDPVALANYVINSVDLTDPLDYSDNGNIAEQSINPGGVSRGALGTFMEKQGSPADQCALLVYLLRQAGVPAVYEFAPRNGLKILDARLSRMLKFQVHGGFSEAGQLYTTNTMIAVNYPWVAAYIGTNWVHIFPWMKDYEITEGLDLYEYMPSNYPSAYPWVKDYIYGNSNLMSLAVSGDNTPRVIFPAYIKQTLQQNHPGVSVGDIGVDVYNRQHYYARWQDFPTPTWVTNISTPLESLTSSGITNISPTLTNIFDTVSVEIYSLEDATKDIQTGDLRLVDLHNREFYINQTALSSNQVQLNLVLMPFRTNITSQFSYSNDTNLLSKEVLSLTLGQYDNSLSVRFRYHRHRAITPAYPIDVSVAFLELNAVQELDIERPLFKGDQAAICMSYGRVTRDMLNVHATDVWQMENALQLNPSLTNSVSPDVYEGATMYLAGMTYYKKVADFDQVNQNLHKVNILSSFAVGLSKISPARDSYGNLTNGVDPVLPNVDMFFDEMAEVGNGTVQPNSGQSFATTQQNYNLLAVTDGSAEEHQVINSFYQQTNAVSTVRLLQLAQSSGAGIVTLTANNYLTQGQVVYQGQQLQNWDAQLWSETVNFLQGSPSSIAYITPGPMTNSAYKGMGALALAWGSWGAFITPQSLNGAFGQPFPAQTMQPGNTGNYNLTGGDSPSISFAPPASGTTLANDEVPAWNVPTVFNQIQNGTTIVDPYESTAWSSAGSALAVSPGGNPNQTFASVFQTVMQSGNLGDPNNAGSDLFDKVFDPVNSVTGEFYVDETDLQLPGPIPLALRRNYSSQNLADNQFGAGWKLSIMPYLSVAAGATNIYAADMDGAVQTYVRTNASVNVWVPTTAANPQLDNNSTAGTGGLANRMRDRIVQTVNGSTTNYTLYGADGSTRNFQVMTFNNGILNQTRPYLQKWTDNRGNYYTFTFGTNSAQTSFGEATRIQCSNGNYIGLDYDIYGHIIDAYSGDGRRLIYDYDQYGDLVTVTLPDATTRAYQYQHLLQAVTNGSAYYSTHLLVEEDKPDGRELINTYDSQRRVTNQLSTAGLDLNPIRTATFIFANNFNITNSYTNAITGYTRIIDGNGNTNRYDYTNSLITKITDPLGQTIQQIWFTTNTTATGYYPRSVDTRIDKRGLVTRFQYDSNGNVTNTLVTGDLTGDGLTSQTATNTALYNSNSLPVQMTDPAGNGMAVVYDPVFNFLPQQSIRYAGATPVSTNFTFYANATNVVINGNVTQTNLAFGLPARQVRAFGSTDAATNDTAFDGHGFIIQTVRYTGTTDPNVTNYFFYNERGNLVVQMDSLGAYVFQDYDAIDRPIEKENFDEFGNSLAWSFKYYNDNGELNWIDGPRYNPEDYVFYDFDGAGRVDTEIHWRSEAKSDGTGVEAPSGYNLYAQTFYQYDPLGNVTLKVDPRGAMTTNTWDALNRLVRAKHLDLDGVTVLSTEGYGYEPGGQVQSYTNALGGITTNLYTITGKPEYRSNPDGSTNAWRYYLDGRIKREIQSNGSYWQTVYDDANRITTRTFYSAANVAEATNSTQLDRRGNAIQKVDAGNNVFTTSFDDLDRAKVSAGPAIVTVSQSSGSGTSPGLGTNVTYVTNVLQQTSTSFFDAAGRTTTNVNALGESTVNKLDALGRPISELIYSASSSLVREKYFAYSADHNSVTVTDGSGATAISHTTYTDTDGHTVLSIAYPASGNLDYSRQQYDLSGNLSYEEHDTSPGGTWTFASYTHDGLNRLTTKQDRDNATTTYTCDPMGDLTNRTMPGGLQWNAIYNNAGQELQDWLVGTGGVGTRTNAYVYYSSGGPFAGLIYTKTDGRGLVSTYSYDDWLRQASISRTDPDYTHVDTFWSYEPRGFVTNITEQYTGNGTGANPKVIARTFDAYGQLSSETVTWNGTSFSTASQSWDAAGRRTVLGINGAGYNFASRADGTLAYASDPTGSGSYGYDTAGLLTNRVVGSRTTAITSRDGEGRPFTISTALNGTTLLTESLGWYGDGTLYSHTLYRPDFTDSRLYNYASLSRRLTQEQQSLNASAAWTNDFTYDSGLASGLGVLTQMGAPSSGSATWNGGVSAFSRINSETNTCITYSAYGRVNGLSTLAVMLDGQPLPVTTNSSGDPSNPYQWRTSMELTPGTHQLKVAAAHPSGFYTAWATNSFTNNIAQQTDAITRDSSGNIGQRTWHKPDGTTIHQQQLYWDAKDRLTDVFDGDAGQNGFYLHAEYDGLNRRLFTQCYPMINGAVQIYGVTPTTINQYFDPMVEFLELGVSYGTKTEWKLYGPDMNGKYGGLNGTGGLDGVSPYLNLFNPIISDFRGNILAEVTNGVANWNTARPTGYGAVPGYRPQALGHGADISLSSAWRGRWVDITGYYQIGMRTYDPVTGMWLSYDSAWNERDPNYLTFAGGDPIRYFDADGRCVEYAGQKVLTGAAQFLLSASNEEDAQPVDYSAKYNANYNYYGNSTAYALNATFNPAVSAEVGAGEMFGGTGLNYNNSGQTLSDNQRVDAGFDFAAGTVGTVGTAVALEGIGNFGFSKIGSLTTSADDGWVSQLQQQQQVGPATGNVGPVRTPNGGVDFANSPDLYPAGAGQQNTVTIEYTGSRRQDFGAANEAAGTGTTQKPPDGYTWHHLDDYDPNSNTGTMQLVNRDAHEATYPHVGGVSQYEKATGNTYK